MSRESLMFSTPTVRPDRDSSAHSVKQCRRSHRRPLPPLPLDEPLGEVAALAGAGAGTATGPDDLTSGDAATSALRVRPVLKGRCACRAVTYEVADEFIVAYNCHCSNCRAMTGSAFSPWREIEPEKLRVTKGEDSLILDGDPTGHHARRCGKCFSLLYWTGYEGKIRVPYGSLLDEPNLKPLVHMFVGSKAPWYEILDGLPQHDGYPWPDE
jgi:hypothetical protein